MIQLKNYMSKYSTVAYEIVTDSNELAFINNHMQRAFYLSKDWIRSP